ncbi:MAG: HD domain-containing phosphohydrolase [Candidatus Omnitrophota bacterium]
MKTTIHFKLTIILILAVIPLFYLNGYFLIHNANSQLKEELRQQAIDEEISTASIISHERFLHNFNNLITIAAIIILIIIASILYAKFTRPISELNKGITRLLAGDFNYTIPIKTTDELGNLVKNFNLMVEHLKQRFEEQSALYEVTQGLTAITELDQLLNKILETAIKLLNAENGSIMLIDQKTKNLTIKAAKGLDINIIKSTQRKIGEGISGWVARENTPLIISAKSENALPVSFIKKENIKNAICVPLDINDKVIGILNISNKQDAENFNWDHLNLLSSFASDVAINIENARVYHKIHRDFLNTIFALAEAIDARTPDMHGHSEKVTTDALKIATKLNFNAQKLEELQISAILHDIGKIGISDKILFKSDKLTPAEYAIIKTHPEQGIKMLARASLSEKIIDSVLHHHERYDGLGYPKRLAGTNIPLFSRIIAIADSFIAMTSKRPYNKTLNTEEALEEIVHSSGTQFDPHLVRVYYDIKINEDIL